MISWRRGKSAGWSAFDLKHRPEKYSGHHQREDEAFPPLSHSSVPVSKKSIDPSYLTTFVHSAESEGYKHFPQDMESDIKNHMNVSDSKSFHLQSDCRLAPDEKKKISDSEFVGWSATCDACTSEPYEIKDLCISFKQHCNDSNGMINGHAKYGVSHMKCNEGEVDCVLSEPEWEEDDIYMIHRKFALRMTRAASHHSRAATKAFLRGDHLSSQQLSKKAKEEWTSSSRLNTEAAKEILSVNNKNNGKWKLDLHGLHVAEAVHFLRERLQEIEESFLFNSFEFYKNSKRHTASLNVVESNIIRKNNESTYERENSTSFIKPLYHCTQRPTALQVITGAGNHSRGSASLPAAVRNYLTDNSYRFEELRPGVFSICPKFG